VLFPLPKENDRPAAFSEKVLDFGTRGIGISGKGFSYGEPVQSLGCAWWRSVDEGAVEVALRRYDWSVVELVFAFETALSLQKVSVCFGIIP
jgi:hypothetical protein